MNERYQRNAIGQLQKLAAQDKPFFLNYWPLFPLNFVPSDIEEAQTLNGGTIAETIVEVDQWIGEIVAEIDRLGIAENTIVIVMGDNGPFMQYAGIGGVSDRVYRGGKADFLEGGVRVNAYLRWPAAVEAGTTVWRHDPCFRSVHDLCAHCRRDGRDSDGPDHRWRRSDRSDTSWRHPRAPGLCTHL